MKGVVTKKLLIAQKTICCLCCKFVIVATMEGVSIVAKEGTTYAIATCFVIVVIAHACTIVAVATCFEIVVITGVPAVVTKEEGTSLVAIVTRIIDCYHSMCSPYCCHV
jgi:hypothetical protein